MKITDRMRVDWLTVGGGTILQDDYEMWNAIPLHSCSDCGNFLRKNPRAAIDAAIRHQAKEKK